MRESTTLNRQPDDPGKNWQLSLPPLPKQKPWWRLYAVTLVVALLAILLILHNHLLALNNPPPQFEELQRQQVEVLGWQRYHPQLHVHLPDGRSRMVEFPSLRTESSGDTYYVISLEQQRQLVGKTCQMWGRPLRFSFQDSYQVFALDCGDGSELDFFKSLESYKKSYGSRLTSWRSFPACLLLFCIAVTFWAETIRNRKDLQKVKP